MFQAMCHGVHEALIGRKSPMRPVFAREIPLGSVILTDYKMVGAHLPLREEACVQADSRARFRHLLARICTLLPLKWGRAVSCNKVNRKGDHTSMTLLRRFTRDDRGQDLIEYALLCGFVTLGVILTVTNIGTTVDGIFDNVGSGVSAAP